MEESGELYGISAHNHGSPGPEFDHRCLQHLILISSQHNINTTSVNSISAALTLTYGLCVSPLEMLLRCIVRYCLLIFERRN